MKTAIVTGAAGFIGQALTEELSRAGVRVYAVVRSGRTDISALEKLPGVRVIHCDMETLDALADMLPEPAEVFYHLAWAGSSGPARADYALQLANARWLVDAVRAAQAAGCRRFVGAGTVMEHDVHAYSPLAGATPAGVSCYGAAKIAAHYMSKAECCRLGLDHLWAYLPNTYGEGNHTQNIVGFATRAMLAGQSPEFTPGEQLYDLVHVSDTAYGLRCIGEKGRKNTAYYIGSGHPEKLKVLLTAVRDAVAPDLPLRLGAIPFNGVMQPEAVFDCTALMKDTGYRPRVSFAEGIERTAAWLRREQSEGRR